MADPGIDDLLTGLAGSARRERAELVEWLLGKGISVAEIRDAVSPMLLALRRLIGDDGTYISMREINEATGIDLNLLQRVLHAIGLARVADPDAAVLKRADGMTAAHVHRFIEAGVDTDHAIQVLRVLAEGLSHSATVMRSAALASIMRPGATELEVAEESYALLGRMAPLLGPMLRDMLFMQLRNQVDTEVVTAGERAAGESLPGARQITAAFADLVGFTRLGEMVPPEELEQLANRLAALARNVAVPPVQFIKTIGDAVMFVCTEPAALLDAVLKLVQASESDDELLRLRVGVASGEAISRAGDWFGSPVNLASRVTGVARPGSVLVAEPVYQELADTERFRWSFAGRRHLKGISGEVNLFRVRRTQGG